MASYEKKYPRLVQVARDIFSIPGMPAKIERPFSGAKLMLPPEMNQTDSMGVGECKRS